MVWTRLRSATLSGITAMVVDIEVDIARGLPSFVIVGLPDAAVKEARDRVKLAIRNAGYRFPIEHITVNLAPAEEKKSGGLDLPIALAILAAADILPPESLQHLAAVGELALNGDLRPIRGALAISEALALHHDVRTLLVPSSSAQEASLLAHKLNILPADNLPHAVALLLGQSPPQTPRSSPEDLLLDPPPSPHDELLDVRGQDLAKRALLVAAAGRHNLLLHGPPGAGKSMLARRLPAITPPLSLQQAIDTTRVYSACGLLPDDTPLITRRPFRAPHHSISDAGLVGGGQGPRPGEISLAHNGILFLDELPEFNRRVLELLREPLENRSVIISRARSSQRFPANFHFIAAMNPCPCGYHGDPRASCTCRPSTIQRYQARISGPLLDRIDLQIPLLPLRFHDLTAPPPPHALSTQRARELISKARNTQARRLGPDRTNADMLPQELEDHAPLDRESHSLLAHAVDHLGLTARAVGRIRRVARTIADLHDEPLTTSEHLAEALSWRQPFKE